VSPRAPARALPVSRSATTAIHASASSALAIHRALECLPNRCLASASAVAYPAPPRAICRAQRAVRFCDGTSVTGRSSIGMTFQSAVKPSGAVSPAGWKPESTASVIRRAGSHYRPFRQGRAATHLSEGREHFRGINFNVRGRPTNFVRLEVRTGPSVASKYSLAGSF
jgi:hypothetical protein